MAGDIPQDDLKVEKLSEEHKNVLRIFKTDNLELKKFLVEDALRNQELSISNTYVWFYKPQDNELVGYITILADAIGINGTRLGDYFYEKGVPYKTLPAIKIGRLCVCNEYMGRGIGSYMIKFAMLKLLILNKDIGCRFISADAKRDAIRFYKKICFEILKAREKGTIPMYYDMIAEIKEYAKEDPIKHKV